MKNSDMPAMPLTGSALTDFGAEANGLTKREYFAGLAMQGILFNAGRNGVYFHNVCEEAVRQADLLLAELEKPE